MAREAFAGTAGGNGADFGSDFGGATFGTDLSAYFGAAAPAAPTGHTAPSAPTGTTKTTTTSSSTSPAAPTAPKATTTTTVTKTVVTSPKPVAAVLPTVSKLTPVHPALQAPSAIKSPFAPSLPSLLKPKLVAPVAPIARPIAPIARPTAPSFTPGVSAFAPPAPFVPSAPIGRNSPFMAAPTGRYLPQGNTYLPPARAYTPERSIWHALNPFNWFKRDVGYRSSLVGQRRYAERGYDQGDSYRALQQAAEARALADSLTPEQSYYPQPVYVAPSITIEDVGDQDDDATDVSTTGTYDDDSNPDLTSPQDSVAGDIDPILAQQYGTAPTERRHHHHHRRDYQAGFSDLNYQQQPSQSAFVQPPPPGYFRDVNGNVRPIGDVS